MILKILATSETEVSWDNPMHLDINKEINKLSLINKPSLGDSRTDSQDYTLVKMVQILLDLWLLKATRTINKLIMINKHSLEGLIRDNQETILDQTDKSSQTLLPSDKLGDCN